MSEETVYIFMVLDGVIARLQMEYDVTKESTLRVTSTPPYRTPDDYGNALARAYRQRDHILERKYDGVRSLRPVSSAEVLVTDTSNPPEDYLFKCCHDGVISDNPDLTEDQRVEKANLQMAGHSLPYGFDMQEYIFWNTMPYSVVQDYISEDLFKEYVARIRAQEEFTQAETSVQIEMVKRMPDALSKRMSFGFAMGAQMMARADHSSLSSKELKQDLGQYKKGEFTRHNHETQIQLCEHAFYWYDRLKGTDLEYLALSKKAALYFATDREHLAVDIYNSMLSKTYLPEDIRAIIEKKVFYIGTGRQLYNEAQALYNAGRYAQAAEKANECINTTSGETKLRINVPLFQLRKNALELMRRRR